MNGKVEQHATAINSDLVFQPDLIISHQDTTIYVLWHFSFAQQLNLDVFVEQDFYIIYFLDFLSIRWRVSPRRIREISLVHREVRFHTGRIGRLGITDITVYNPAFDE